MTAEDFLDAPGPATAGMPTDKTTAEAFLGEAPPQTFAAGFRSGFAGKDQVSGLTAPNIGEELGRSALPILGGAVGSLGGPAISAAGAGVGRAAQNVTQSYINNTDLGVNDLLISPVVEGAGQYLGGKLIENAALPLGRALVKRAAGTIGGVPAEAFERLVERPADVLSAMSRDPQGPAHYAGLFKQAVEENVKRAGEAYEAIINRVLGSAASAPTKPSLPGLATEGPQRFDLLSGIGSKLAKISDDFGFGLPDRLTNNIDGANIFRAINEKIQGMTDVSTKDVYYLQRDLNNLARQYQGTPLGAAIGRTRSAVMDYIGQALPEIGQANRIYAAAKGLQEEAAPLLHADDLPAKIAHAFRRNTEVKGAAERVANGIPEARQALEQMRDATAGQAFAEGLAFTPRTGIAAGLGALGGHAIAGNPTAMVGAALTAPFLSPRLTGNLVGAASLLGQYATGQGVGPAALQAAYRGVQTAAAAPASVALIEAYRRRRLAP